MDTLPRYQTLTDALLRYLKLQARVRGTQQDAADRMSARRESNVGRLAVSRLLTGRAQMPLPIFLELLDDIVGEGTAQRIIDVVVRPGHQGESHVD